MEFELDEAEQSEFRRATGISTNQRLPIQVTLSKRNASVKVSKQGKGSHDKRAREIASFIVDRVSILHIPAVRTGETAKTIAEEILASRRRSILRSTEYADLIARLRELDQTAVAEVEEVLLDTLKRFVPGTQSVTIQVRDLTRASILEDIQIDDGASTSIGTKGDGIQSLAALALTLEWTRSKSRPEGELIVAVEEPESHLHPGAVHELRTVLRGIAETQQVIVTTHSQALVNRSDIKQNVVVSNRGAKRADTIDDLRKALGVRLSDALAPTEVIVIAEGWLDEKILPPLLTQRETEFKNWIADGRVAFESAGSGSKIYARALAARSILTQPVVVFDGDESGVKDVRRLESDGIIDSTCVIQIKRKGLKHAELEDIFLSAMYISAVEQAIGFTLSPRQRRTLDEGRSGAWSERLENILETAGVATPKTLVKRAKHAVFESILEGVQRGEAVVRQDSEPLLDRLVDVIRRQLQNS
ncbi:ATP-dependent nuclease [Mycolicibacterium fortuitum]|uniref:ATP-dependent nuclease n=1 Tax=Mycolicibacterium fortuitum TaxID=1766 RepID=UPI003F64AA7D